MKIVEYVKTHPLTVAGLGVGIIVLYWLYSSGSSSQAVAAAPAQQYDSSLQQAQFALQGQNQALQYHLAETTNANNAQVAIATLQAQLGGLQTSVSRDVSLAGIQAQENVQLSGQQSQVQLAQVEAQSTQAQIGAARDISLAQAATYAHLADVQGATVAASYQVQQNIAQISADRDVAINLAQQKTARKSSDNGLFGNILGTIGSVAAIFSDNDLKVDVQTAGYDDKGRRWVTYRYKWDAIGVRRFGVIAQEIASRSPEAVSRDPASGYLKVNYGAL